MNLGQTFIFDLDGTLIDSKNQIINCVNATRSDLGYKNRNPNELFSRIGLPVESLFDDLHLEEEVLKQVISRFRQELKIAIKSGNPVFPGVTNFLTLVRDQGIKIGIATSKPHDLAKIVVANSPISGMVDYVQGIEGFPGKPNPEVILRVMKNLEAHDYLMFGDRIEDIEAANFAKIKSIGISQGFHTQSELINAGAKKVFSSFILIDSPNSLMLL